MGAFLISKQNITAGNLRSASIIKANVLVLLSLLKNIGKHSQKRTNVLRDQEAPKAVFNAAALSF